MANKFSLLIERGKLFFKSIFSKKESKKKPEPEIPEPEIEESKKAKISYFIVIIFLDNEKLKLVFKIDSIPMTLENEEGVKMVLEKNFRQYLSRFSEEAKSGIGRALICRGIGDGFMTTIHEIDLKPRIIN